MSPNPLPYDESELSELGRRLRRLARHLVGDEAGADDVAQDAWLAALQAPGSAVRDLGSWIGGAARNLARRRHRRERTESAAVEEAGRLARQLPELEPLDGEAHASKKESFELLRDTTARLREPYREVIYLRFFEERSVREISQKLGRPEKTIKSQVRRGLDQMRSSLDHEFSEDRAAWIALLVPRGMGSAPSREPKALGAPAARALRAAALLGLASVGAVWLLQPPASVSLDEPTLAGAPTTTSTRDELAAPLPGNSDRTAVVATASSPATAAGGAVPPRFDLSVTVLDEAGQGVPSATVEIFRHEELLELLSTDTSGEARASLEPQQIWDLPLELGHGRGVVVRAWAPGRARSDKYYVPCPPGETMATVRLDGAGFDLVGRVVDERDEPIAGASVHVRDRVAGVRRTEDGSVAVALQTEVHSNAEGRFAIASLRAGSDVQVSITAPGFVELTHAERSAGEPLDKTYVMRSGTRIEGTIWTDDGPAASARIWVESHGIANPAETKAAEDGTFVLAGLSVDEHVVFACAAEEPGHNAYTILVTRKEAAARWDVVLRERPPLALQLVTAQDAPVRRATVVLGGAEGGAAWQRHLVADDEGRVRFEAVTDGPLRASVFTVEGLTRGESDLTIEGLLPSPEEQLVRLDGRHAGTCTVRGLLLDEYRAPVAGVLPHAYHLEHSIGRSSAPGSAAGEFGLQGLFAGEQRVLLFAQRGYLDLGTLTLQPGELDLGTIQAPPASVVRIVAPPSARSLVLYAQLELAGFSTGLFEQRVRVLPSPPPDTLHLWPGSYSIFDQSANRGRTFNVGPGETVEVRLDSVAGAGNESGKNSPPERSSEERDG